MAAGAGAGESEGEGAGAGRGSVEVPVGAEEWRGGPALGAAPPGALPGAGGSGVLV